MNCFLNGKKMVHIFVGDPNYHYEGMPCECGEARIIARRYPPTSTTRLYPGVINEEEIILSSKYEETNH